MRQTSPRVEVKRDVLWKTSPLFVRLPGHEQVNQGHCQNQAELFSLWTPSHGWLMEEWEQEESTGWWWGQPGQAHPQWGKWKGTLGWPARTEVNYRHRLNLPVAKRMRKGMRDLTNKLARWPFSVTEATQNCQACIYVLNLPPPTMIIWRTS